MKKKINKISYLVNWFTLFAKYIEQYSPFNISILYFKSHRFDTVTNFLNYFFKQIQWKLKKYNVIHINNWENFLNAKKIKWQILIWESHWFHFWLNFKDTLKHFKWFKKYLSKWIDFLLWWLIRYKIKKFDIYYVSTPNMLDVAKKIRLSTMWLPNPVNIDIFKLNWKKKVMEWNPIIFQPTRLHSFKNPKFGIDLFYKIKRKYPNATLHLIEYPNGGDYYEEYYKKILTDDQTFFWHWFKSKSELAEMYRWADIVLWHFHKDLWMMSGVELEATLCWTAVISYDKYEIKTDLDQLESITFDILNDKDSYNKFVSKNIDIVLKNHSPDRVSDRIVKDIEFQKLNINIKPLYEKLILRYKNELWEIEKKYFSNIGTWNIDNFLYKLENKFENSFLLFKWGILIWYIIWSHNNIFWYVNRFAVHNDHKWLWLWKHLLDYFSDNLKYNTQVKVIELVTHINLNIDGFYLKNGYNKYTNQEDIEKFLKRKNKIEELNNYIWKNKKLISYYKTI